MQKKLQKTLFFKNVGSTISQPCLPYTQPDWICVAPTVGIGSRLDDTFIGHLMD